ncbi:hypothetical protein PI93_000190 [Pandoraea fibrosis]|uniref:Lipoprotein n=1 Tax=Pandoraea fibrosis TaxID=1891094 RepID=A0ABX6HKC8_9BURK|nr:hypothetical protein [Pandoraea fibrosis]QHE90406.1 hypothetical protein PJ20_000190 [Pandoraea fibrosis]QHF11238.1 hypothetical protein PI93_000190 [Pandoraea fibrosis]
MKRLMVLMALVLLCTACVPRGAQPSLAYSPLNFRMPKPEDNLIRKPGFLTCESEAFVALGYGRQVIVFKSTQASLLAGPDVGALQIALIDELFKRMQSEGFSDYPRFAAEKFYACTEREKVPVEENLTNASICLFRQDVLFYLNERKKQGRSLNEATLMVSKMYRENTEEVLPQRLIDMAASMVYKAKTDEDMYALRRFHFESCLFPDQWKAWWNAQQTPRNRLE